MPQSHPPTLITLTQRALLGECGVSKGDRILLAISGGVDSMCLLHVLAKLSEKLELKVFAHGVDHGLRAEAGAELDAAQSFAENLGVAFGRTTLRLATGGNIQHRAREARYAALTKESARVGAHLIATAHHADDRAETVLIRLLQGAGPAGLSVLPARAEGRVRPFIRATRSDIARHAERHRIPHSEDPSNMDRRFLRSQVRHELLPQLVRLSPGIVSHLTALADALQAQAQTVEPRPSALLGRAQLGALWAALEKGQPGPRIAVSDRLELHLQRRAPARSRKNR